MDKQEEILRRLSQIENRINRMERNQESINEQIRQRFDIMKDAIIEARDRLGMDT